MVILRSSDSRKESEPILALRSALGWLETQDAHMSKADLPGLKKDDVKVQLKDERILQISRAWRRLRKAMLGTLWSVLM